MIIGKRNMSGSMMAAAAVVLVVLVVGGHLLWRQLFRYDGSQVSAFTSIKNDGMRKVVIRKKETDWIIQEGDLVLASASMASDSMGHYRFTVLSTSVPRISQNMRFSLTRADAPSGVMICDGCVNTANGHVVLPMLWALAED